MANTSYDKKSKGRKKWVWQPLPEKLEAALWHSWRKCQEIEKRSELIEHYLPYARMVAATYYAARHHDEIEFAEYFQLASLGLVESIDRFDPDIGVQFRTFASQRMRGAILNGLEQITEKQQQIAVRQRLQKERIDSLKEDRASAPSGGKEQLFRHLADVGIGLALSYMLEGTGMVDSKNVPSELGQYYQKTELKQLQKRIASLVSELSEQAQIVMRYHYFQEVPFEQIAAILGVTKGRVAQVHRQSLQRLGELVKCSKPCDVAW